MPPGSPAGELRFGNATWKAASLNAAFSVLLFPALLLGACSGGGGGGGSTDTGPGPVVATGDGSVRVSVQNPFSPNCAGAATGTLYPNAEVEPYLAVNPANSANFIAVWQQDRWSNGSSQGVVTGVSMNSGQSWQIRTVPFSICAGGTAANGGNFARATDPWVTFSPNGVAYQMALSSTGGTFTADSDNAMLVSRSTDGGLTWSTPAILVRDGAQAFNDKNAITADPTDARFVYAVWDRLPAGGGGPAYLARSTDGGLTWEPARSIFDPGVNSQTIGNLVVVLPNGTLVNLFTRIDGGPNNTQSASVAVIRSTDHGATWSAPIRVADMLARGARDPDTGTAIRDGAIIAQMAAGPNGELVAVWQDARFSSGARDGIALSRSTDAGLTWSAPVRVNADAAVQAFTPAVHVRADGTIGVTYFDLRSNTADPATLPTDYWLARSSDGVTWNESRVSGPFNLATAPIATGLFLGDYMALKSVGTTFLPLYVTTTADLTNRNDVFIKMLNLLAGSAEAGAADKVLQAEARLPTYLAPTAPPLKLTAELRQQFHEAIVRAMERRIPGWGERMKRKVVPPG